MNRLNGPGIIDSLKIALRDEEVRRGCTTAIQQPTIGSDIQPDSDYSHLHMRLSSSFITCMKAGKADLLVELN